MAEEFNMEEGIERIIEGIQEARKERVNPVLIAVYGLANSGKSELMKRVIAKIKTYGWGYRASEGTISESGFIDIREEPKTISLPDPFIYMFHCCWDRVKETDYDGDPNVLARKILGTEIHLNVGIYNPNNGYLPLRGEYDLVIRNPESQIKTVPRLEFEIERFFLNRT